MRIVVVVVGCVFSSPEPKAHTCRWAYRILMVRRTSVVVVRRPQCSKIISKTAWPIKAKFYVEPPGKGERKFVCGIWVTWPRWPSRPYMVKPFKNLLQNRQADFHETWYVASGTPAHQKFFKWWPLSDPDLFYGKVKFGNWGFSIGKSENSGFFRNIAASDLKVSGRGHLIEYMKICEYWRSRSFLCHIFSRFYMFCALQDQDIRWAFTGPLVLCFYFLIKIEKMYSFFVCFILTTNYVGDPEKKKVTHSCIFS